MSAVSAKWLEHNQRHRLHPWCGNWPGVKFLGPVCLVANHTPCDLSGMTKADSTFKLVEIDNACLAYTPIFITPSKNVIKEQLNKSLGQDWFQNCDREHSSVKNFFLTKTFSLEHLTKAEIDQLAHTLPSILGIYLHNVSALLKPIDQKYQNAKKTGGTTLVILTVGMVMYVWHWHVYMGTRLQTKEHGCEIHVFEEIELQPMSLWTTNWQVQPKSKVPVTPKLLQKKLEEGFRVYYKCDTWSQIPRKRANSAQWCSLVCMHLFVCVSLQILQGQWAYFCIMLYDRHVWQCCSWSQPWWYHSLVSKHWLHHNEQSHVAHLELWCWPLP